MIRCPRRRSSRRSRRRSAIPRARLQFQVSALDYIELSSGRLGIGRIRRGKIKPWAGSRGAQRLRSPRARFRSEGEDRAGAGVLGPRARAGRDGDGRATIVRDRRAWTSCRSAPRWHPSKRRKRCRRSRWSTSPRCRWYFTGQRRRRFAGQRGQVRDVAQSARAAPEGTAYRTWRCASRRPATPMRSSYPAGELHLTILIENMRREGFELAASRPRVVLREVGGVTCEPYETLSVDGEVGASGRRHGGSRAAPRRSHEHGIGQPGPHASRLPGTVARSSASMAVHDDHPRHRPHEPRIRHVCAGEGRHALASQRRADFLGARAGRGVRALEPGGARPHVRLAGRGVYEGMVIGIHSRDNDLIVNPVKGKKLTNVRASGRDEAVLLDAADRAHAGVRGGVHRRRRAGRGDAAVDSLPQAVSQGP